MITKTYVIKMSTEGGTFVSRDPVGEEINKVTFVSPVKVISVDRDVPDSRFMREDLYSKEEVNKALVRGQNEAWALAQKIVNSPANGGYSSEDLNDIFFTSMVCDCFRGNTYQEAAKKVDAWVEAHRMLKVGTVVKVIDKDHMYCGKRGFIIDSADTMVGPSYLVTFHNGESCMLRYTEIERVADYDIESLFKLMEENDG